MWTPRTTLWITLLCLVPTAGRAQTTSLSDHPGYFPLEELEIISSEEASVEINLQGAMLKMIGKATIAEDPEFAEIVSNLEAIRVRIAPMENLDPDKARSAMAQGAALLEERGWQAMVRIRDEDEQVYIYSLESGESMAGMTVLVVDSDEAVMVNLVGDIDFESLGSLVMGLDLPQVGRALQQEDYQP